MIPLNRLQRRAAPKPIAHQLRRQPLILAILRAQNLRPLHAQLAPHVREMIARTRKHKRHLTRRRERCRRIKNPLRLHAPAARNQRRRFLGPLRQRLRRALRQPHQFLRIPRDQHHASRRVCEMRFLSRPPTPRRRLDRRAIRRACKARQAP